MRLDVLARLALRVRPPQMIQPVEEARDRSAARNMGHFIEIGGKHGQDGRQIRRRPVAVHIAFGKTDIAARNHLSDDSVIGQLNDGVRAFTLAFKLNGTTVRQHDGQCPDFQFQQHAQG